MAFRVALQLLAFLVNELHPCNNGSRFPTKKMALADGKKFAHRANRDGTFDSICLQCFRTVASSANEAELGGPEGEHVCEDRILDRCT